ncbi:MAG: S8 family serine peptidase [Acidobacteriota bacterium]|nr:MAG: S8 family serine peptidase [Acidobacteriota bacterium]
MFHEQCPLCGRTGRRDASEVDDSLLELIRVNNPRWTPDHGLCQRCLDLFRGARDRLRANPKIFREGVYHILPTPIRVGADERFAGRGVTIAFLDSGFYPHPDLIEPHNRILRYVNISDPDFSEEELRHPDDSSWHGMMTSVVATGSGHLSNGIYRGLASEARLVLIKVGSAHRILHDDIRRGLEWVIEHRREYDIRVVNVSCAGDYEESYLTDGLSQAAENCVRAGIVVVCAAGNAGNTPNHAILPPASTPAVITVGGFNDQNTLELEDNDVYQSSYGPTIDGLQKPEIVAPSIWLAAPILPGTPTAAEATLYKRLQEAHDHEIRDVLKQSHGIDADLDAAVELPVYLIRHLVSIKIHDANVISGHYKHVDGTSFAAPIVSSVVAQMLEANRSLTPQQVKRILIETAIRLARVPHERQGWGTVIPGRAVHRADGSRQ